MYVLAADVLQSDILKLQCVVADAAHAYVVWCWSCPPVTLLADVEFVQPVSRVNIAYVVGAVKRRSVKQLGWSVLSVPFYHWNQLATTDMKQVRMCMSQTVHLDPLLTIFVHLVVRKPEAVHTMPSE